MAESDLEKRQNEASISRFQYTVDPFCWARVWGHGWVHYLLGLFINSIIWIQNFILACWRNSFIGILIISAGYFGTLFELASHLRDEIGFLSKVEIKSWYDRRNLGLSVKCRYAPSYPPKNIMREVSAYPYIDKRITYIHLATPYDFDREYVAENEPQRHLTRAEATTFYRSRPDLRPCHSDGNPIRLIAPDAPDNPIID